MQITFGVCSNIFKEKDINQPSKLRREHVTNYLEWRKRHGGQRNTAVHEIKFLAQILDEAINRGYIDKNPARKLGIKKDSPAEKNPWSNDEIARVEQALVERDRFGWMHATFLMGLNQAVRLRQSKIPLSRIDFKRRIIDYPNENVKGAKGYSQPISPDFFPILQELVAHRKAIGKSTLCDMPSFGASIEWRRFLDELGLKTFSSSWIARNLDHASSTCRNTRIARKAICESRQFTSACHLSEDYCK